ncbi:MAG: T9SS type A sorting domain-containing protein [Chlorobi bacterium]|nr:T9SS type A sorting domain-containing protein [Chlorobiota bacterium]
MKTKLTIFFLLFYSLIHSQTNEWTIYNTNNTPQTGPCNSHIFDITQDKDSNLWFSTENGVTKYNGQKWQSYFAENDNGQDNIYNRIVVSKEYRVYISTWILGGGFSIISNGKIEVIDYITVFDMDIDSTNNVWLATPEGLKKYDGTDYVDISTEHEMLNQFIDAVKVDRNNHIWAGTYNGVLYYNDTTWQLFTTNDGLLDNFVFYIEVDSENNIWMMNGLGFSKFDGQSFTNFPLPDSLNEGYSSSMTIGHDNTLYVATDDYGILKFNEGNFSFMDTAAGLKSNYILSTFEDYNQNLWIGYIIYGVDKYNGSEFINYTGNGMNSIDVLRYYDDKLFIGSIVGGISIYDGENWENYNISNGFLSNSITDIDKDNEGNIWISTFNGISMYNGFEFTDFTENGGLPQNNTFSIFADNNDNIWVGTYSKGVALYNGQNWKYYNSENSLISKSVDAIMQDNNNTMWFGTIDKFSLFDGYIVSYDGENWNSFTPIEGEVNDILQDSKGNIWFGYVFTNSDYSVAKYNYNDGWEIYKLPYDDSVFHDQSVFDIYEDKDSLLWFGKGQFGSTTFDGENWVNHTQDEGYPETSNRAITQDAEGNMWFGSYLKGLYKHNVGTGVTEPQAFTKPIANLFIYPNPATNMVTVQNNFDYKNLTKLELYNTAGKKLLEKEYRFKTNIDISSYPAGIYIVKAGNKKYSYSGKLVKK